MSVTRTDFAMLYSHVTVTEYPNYKLKTVECENARSGSTTRTTQHECRIVDPP